MAAVESYQSPWTVDTTQYPAAGSIEEKLAFLVRYAVLAPSVHNTQPWAFTVDDNRIRVFADQTRRLSAADRDMRDLYVSLGCAIENLVVAGEHFGFRLSVTYLPAPENPLVAAEVEASDDGVTPPSEVFGLFRAIPVRRTNHEEYSQERVNEHDLHHLAACCVEEGVSITFTGDEVTRSRFADLLRRADVLRFSDDSYIQELEFWVRQGAYNTAWLVKKLHQLACAVRGSECASYSDPLKGASVLGALSTSENDRPSQMRAGRVFERIFLRATGLGLSLEPITYVLQVPETREDATFLLPESAPHAQIAFRLGYSASEPQHSSRREIGDTLVSSRAVVGGALRMV